MSWEAIPYKQFISALTTVGINCTVYCGVIKFIKKLLSWIFSLC